MLEQLLHQDLIAAKFEGDEVPVGCVLGFRDCGVGELLQHVLEHKNIRQQQHQILKQE